MVPCRRGLALASGLLLSFFSAAVPPLTAASDVSSVGVTIRHHDLFVQIDPDRHRLVATDRMTIDLSQAQQAVIFSLAPTLQLDRLVLSVGDKPADEAANEIPFEIEHDAAQARVQRIRIPAAILTAGKNRLTAQYHGLIDDPPKEPRHLRFVTPSETSGHIGPEGVYLSSESQWYLDLPDSLSTYRLLMALPPEWTAVTQGKPRTSTPCPSHLCPQGNLIMTEWEMAQPTEALTVAANRFVSKVREWVAKSGQSVQIATYLFPEDAPLADEYLDATARYLDAYIPLLGPYPFDSFAVVENFFASGLGMPSFTLLGSGIIKRHYVQPYALGHEIVHSWIGNAVFNRVDRGNWVEGLTTYLANYYWHELSGEMQQARDQRRLMLRGYNLHVPPARDYPVGQFTQKHDERDNAIGYQKAAMVFHLLRQEVGDDAFWLGLKRLVAQYRGRHAEWHDLERIFSEAVGRDLRWFFIQWVERDGAPVLSVEGASAHPTGSEGGRTFQLTVTVGQAGDAFRVSVPLLVRMDDGREQPIQGQSSRAHDTITATLPARPKEIVLDPDVMLMRRIPRQALPPVLNHYVTDGKRSVVLAFSDPADGSHPFRGIVTRIEAQDSQRAVGERATTAPLSKDALLPREGSVLVLGSPEARTAIQSLIGPHCGDLVTLRDGGLTLAGTAYDGAGIAVLANCHRHDQPGSVVTLLYAVTPQAATTVARLVFFYGWNSYVVFKDGSAIARGEWAGTHDRMEVSVDERDVVR
jgi:aminopeptidase N